MRRSGAHRATDTLSVAWLAGTFGHGAQASPASFLNHMNCLKHVYTKVGPSGVPPPRARALSRECYAYHIRLFLGRLWDHSKDSCMSLFHPFANCETDGTKTVALVCESQLSRCRRADPLSVICGLSGQPRPIPTGGAGREREVVGSLHRLLHESIQSICSLSP